MLVGQLIEILKQFDQDREVMIHTLSGQNAEVKGYFPKDDETGRFIVKSLTTGKTYYVEPIGNGHPADWGDINPATKKIEGDYGQKYTGCVSEKDSLITEENGFHLIETLGPGISPISVIYQRDLSYGT